MDCRKFDEYTKLVESDRDYWREQFKVAINGARLLMVIVFIETILLSFLLLKWGI